MDPPLQKLIRTLSKLPGLGPRSAQRSVLFLLKDDAASLEQLLNDLIDVQRSVKRCSSCGNLSHQDPCSICTDPKRNENQLCIVESVSDLWAIEQAQFFKGRFHVLGGLLSAIDGIGPKQLNTQTLIDRIQKSSISEVILAFSATIEGQTTTYFLADLLASAHVHIFSLAQGIPFGGELNYLDDGTLSTAFFDKKVILARSNDHAA